MKIPLSAQQQKRLANMWARQKANMTQSANDNYNARIIELTRGDGVLRTNTIPPLDGDVIGLIEDNTVVALRGILLSTTAPTNGQVLKYNSTLNRWVPTTLTSGGGGGGSSGEGYWEPITDGDLDDPQLMFENGDVLMDFVST
jgi:hypothetical protein